MQNQDTPQSPEEKIRSMYDDERTQNRIQEHLNNEDDVITEQDIANISTGIVNPGVVNEAEIANDEPSQEEELIREEDEDLKDKKIHNNEDPDIQTSWNILG